MTKQTPKSKNMKNRKFTKISKILLIIPFIILLMSGCKNIKEENSIENEEEFVVKTNEINTNNDENEIKEPKIEIKTDDDEVNIEESEIENTLKFVDVFGKEYETTIIKEIPKKEYENEKFIHNEDKLYYEDDKYISRLGVDVSSFQKDIDWNKVKEDGYEFAFIRIGFRGYGKAGNIVKDKWFDKNIKKAKEAGLDVGVYFFSQAINEEEAIEEAEFVLECLQDNDLELPIIYDPESILDAPARTDEIKGEQFTNNAIAFCNTIKEGGYTPGIYSNMLWEAFELDLTKLNDIPVWYADYEQFPQTPYMFEYWQYLEKAKVSGINGLCDVDIQMIQKNRK